MDEEMGQKLTETVITRENLCNWGQRLRLPVDSRDKAAMIMERSPEPDDISQTDSQIFVS